jgi:hypothetical protein
MGQFKSGRQYSCLSLHRAVAVLPAGNCQWLLDGKFHKAALLWSVTRFTMSYSDCCQLSGLERLTALGGSLCAKQHINRQLFTQ